MRRMILVMLVVVVFGLLPPASQACFCVSPEVPEAFEEAEAVFIGEVAEIIPARSYDENVPFSDRLDTVRFTVEKSYKGIQSTEIELLSDQSIKSCLRWSRSPFVKGMRYLVYAYPYPADKGGSMAVLSCTNRTGLVSEVFSDVLELQGLPVTFTDTLRLIRPIRAVTDTFDYSFQPFPVVKSRKESFVDSWIHNRKAKH